MAEPHGTARIQVTSVDGNLTHPFRVDQTVDEVRVYAYDKLVQDKGQTPIESTWMEQGGTRLDGNTVIASLIDLTKQPGKEIDLTLNLAWTQQGGRESR
jgi:hypothetical protein